jgi:ethanolamine permease
VNILVGIMAGLHREQSAFDFYTHRNGDVYNLYFFFFYTKLTAAIPDAGYLPKFLETVNQRFQTPHWVLIMGGLVGFVAIFFGNNQSNHHPFGLGGNRDVRHRYAKFIKASSKKTFFGTPFQSSLLSYFPYNCLFFSTGLYDCYRLLQPRNWLNFLRGNVYLLRGVLWF